MGRFFEPQLKAQIDKLKSQESQWCVLAPTISSLFPHKIIYETNPPISLRPLKLYIPVRTPLPPNHPPLPLRRPLEVDIQHPDAYREKALCWLVRGVAFWGLGRQKDVGGVFFWLFACFRL
jgi:hypothetical protein